MGEWWQQPYPGGRMVPAPPLPRILHPPDQHGQKPELEGEDVEAYKRVCWRAGRWPGPASGFDREYSNDFAYGKTGGNVGDSGVAGVQRQGAMAVGLGPGIVDDATYNLFRSIRIPAGLPHAGEPAMDSNAQNLLYLAHERLQPPPPNKSLRELALAEARKWIGYVEAANNNTVFGDWYGMNYQPWCAIFASYAFENSAKGGSPSFEKGKSYSYVPYMVSDAQAGRNGFAETVAPIAGDLVCYSWDWDSVYDHVGIFQSGSAQQFVTVEGNTSSGTGGSQSNGGGVYERVRDASQQLTFFIRVAEP